MIWFIDQNLKDVVGHYFSYAYALHRYAKENNIDMKFLGSKQVSTEITSLMPIEPAFRYGVHTRFKLENRFLQRLINNIDSCCDFIMGNLEFYNDLKRSLHRRITKKCILFAPTINHKQLLAWAWWLRSMKADECPTTVLMLRLNYFTYDGSNVLTHDQFYGILAFKILEMLAHNRRIRLVTDSHLLASEYASLINLPIEVFPIPHTKDVSLSNGRYTGNGKVRIVSLGDARGEKGFQYIVQAIELLQKHQNMNEMHYILQCHIPSPFYMWMKQYISTLENMNLSNVELIKTHLSTEEYKHLLVNSDIVLLPYNKRDYYSRTSGPMAEALAAAKPVVVTKGTWMSSQLPQFGAGVTFNDGDAQDLARAIREAVSKFKELSEQAQLRCRAWNEFHNPKVFFKMLCS